MAALSRQEDARRHGTVCAEIGRCVLHCRWCIGGLARSAIRPAHHGELAVDDVQWRARRRTRRRGHRNDGQGGTMLTHEAVVSAEAGAWEYLRVDDRDAQARWRVRVSPELRAMMGLPQIGRAHV